MKRKYRGIFIALGVLAVIGVGTALYHGGKSGRSEVKRTSEYTSQLFGENTYIFTPEDEPAKVQEVLDKLWTKQEANQFGEARYAVYFMPGVYDESIEARVGFYMQVSGLGKLPTDTQLPQLNTTATWLGDDANHNATCNFWRGVENLKVNSNVMWAVSQATFMRHVDITGALYLHDNYGWASGGFLADSHVQYMIDSGSQQQWLTRNCDYKTWMGENWNLVFMGDAEGSDPTGTWPAKAYTQVEETPVIREKPYLVYTEKDGFEVCVPGLRKDAVSTSWNEENAGENTYIPIKEFYIADPEKDSADSINKALEQGKNLFLTPGIYELNEPIEVTKENTIILGTGLATLRAMNGNACIEAADADGIIIAGLLFDAGPEESENLLVVGTEGTSGADHKENPICLSDLFFRVGGGATGYAAKVDKCVTLNSNDIIGDNFWVWRADHGDEVAWDKNTAKNGIIINGDRNNMYALMVEHFQEYQTVWNGNDGLNVMYQSEMPYDVPKQAEWQSHDGAVNGYASFYVADNVDSFRGIGIGIYSYHRDAIVEEYSAMEVPAKPEVTLHNVCAIMITGNPGISHVVNSDGGPAYTGGARAIIIDYANGTVIK